MHSLLHLELARSADADLRRGDTDRALRRAVRPEPPPRRVRPFVARVLGTAAGHVDREAARRSVA